MTYLDIIIYNTYYESTFIILSLYQKFCKFYIAIQAHTFIQKKLYILQTNIINLKYNAID
jgi:hypothetical protein